MVKDNLRNTKTVRFATTAEKKTLRKRKFADALVEPSESPVLTSEEEREGSTERQGSRQKTQEVLTN